MTSRNIKKKISSAILVLIGASIIAAIMSLFLYLATPYLPESAKNIISIIKTGDWGTKVDSLKNAFESFGLSNPQVFFSLQLLQVLFAPIPGQLTGFLGGLLFGFWKGLALTMFGLTVGSLIAILVSRFFGETIIRRFVNKKIIGKFDYLIEEGGIINFFLIFLLPGLPDDAVCFIAGLTKLNISKLLFVCILGRLPGMAVLTFTGANITSNMFFAKAIFAIAMIGSFLIWFFEEDLKRLAKETFKTRPL